MLRWSIIQTLLYKEYLRYRYNWGLLVVVLALLVLSFLVSLSSRFKTLFRQAGTTVTDCYILHNPDDERVKKWADYLESHPPPRPYRVHSQPYRKREDFKEFPTGSMGIELNPRTTPDATEKTPIPEGTWRARYWYTEQASVGVFPYRDWFARETHSFVGASPRFEEETVEASVFSGQKDDMQQVPLIVTALVIFALYLLSFNLYITSTGEEREKRLLLGLLLSPASPEEIIAAKVIFYASASLVVSLAVAGMYKVSLLANPYLWGTIICGSVGYVAIGTVVISVVRRQTTINTISMLYLIGTTVIMLLGEMLGNIFGVLKIFLMENFLYAQMKQIITGQPGNLLVQLLVLYVFAAGWTLIAMRVFSKQGMAISRAR